MRSCVEQKGWIVDESDDGKVRDAHAHTAVENETPLLAGLEHYVD